MAMHCQVPLARILPHVPLIHGNTNHVRHQLRQPVVVIAFNPHNPPPVARVGELADARKKIPVLACEPCKVESTEDVAQQNQLTEVHVFQHINRLFRATDG